MAHYASIFSVLLQTYYSNNFANIINASLILSGLEGWGRGEEGEKLGQFLPGPRLVKGSMGLIATSLIKDQNSLIEQSPKYSYSVDNSAVINYSQRGSNS